MTYIEAIRALNEAAYAAIRAGKATTALPNIDRQALRQIAPPCGNVLPRNATDNVIKPTAWLRVFRL